MQAANLRRIVLVSFVAQGRRAEQIFFVIRVAKQYRGRIRGQAFDVTWHPASADIDRPVVDLIGLPVFMMHKSLFRDRASGQAHQLNSKPARRPIEKVLKLEVANVLSISQMVE